MSDQEDTVSVALNDGRGAKSRLKRERLDLDALEKVARDAEKSAPGAWSVEDPMDHELSIVQADKPTYEWRFIAHCPLPDEDEHEAFTGGEISRLAKHIASFDPPTVLRLIDAARASEASPLGAEPGAAGSDRGRDEQEPLPLPTREAEPSGAEITISRAEARRLVNYAFMASSARWTPFIRENGVGGEESPWGEFLRVADRLWTVLFPDHPIRQIDPRLPAESSLSGRQGNTSAGKAETRGRDEKA